jgi:hypothetical protein
MAAIIDETQLAAHPPAVSYAPAGIGFRARLKTELTADRPIYLLAALYILFAVLLSEALPRHPPVFLLLYAPIWLHAGGAILLGFILVRTLPELVRERPDRPLALMVSRTSAYATPRAAAGLLLIALQMVLMGTFTSVKNMLPEISGYVWDTDLANIGRFIFAGHDSWTYFTPVVVRLGLLGALEFLYVTGWMVALGLIPALVALVPSLAPIRVRFFLTYILCWALLGNLIALLGMSAGPVYFGEVTGNYTRYGQLVQLLAANSGSTWSAYDIQRSLWVVYERGMSSLGSGISAFPSLHVAMATLWAITGFQRSRLLGFIGVAFLCLILVASVALGWHYAIDGLAAIVMVLLLWAGVGWVLARAGVESRQTSTGW